MSSGVVTEAARLLGASRWDGTPGRLEVWYTTLTDPATGTGVWHHLELVAPTGGGAPHALGWIALFPPDRSPSLERFGPEPLPERVVTGGDGGGGGGRIDAWVAAAGTTIGPGRLAGESTTMAWDLAWSDDAAPLYTFPKAIWDRELLPGQQVVPAPSASFDGEIRHAAGTLRLEGARGGLARIYGHGSAERWAWLHADLGGGDVCELVTAVSRRPGLRLLPPVTFLQLRVGGRDWPRNPLASAPGLPGHIGLPDWSVDGYVGRYRVRVEVHQPDDRCVALGYVDPDGATATCTNTEVADANVVVERWSGRWRLENAWRLAGTAHAEVGVRP